MSEYFKKVDGEYVPVEGFKSQAEIDNAIEKRVKRMNEELAEQKAKFESITDEINNVDKIKSDYEAQIKELNDKLTTANNDLNASRLETKKVTIMREFNIKPSLAEFVTGDDEKTMRARAEVLAHETSAGSVDIEKSGKPEKSLQSDTATIAKQLFSTSDD